MQLNLTHIGSRSRALTAPAIELTLNLNSKQVSQSMVSPLVLTLEGVLDDHIGRKYLRRFLERNHNAENMLFLECIYEYSVCQSNSLRFKKASVLVERFVKVGSQHEINLSSSVRQQVLQDLESCFVDNCPNTLFNECVFHVLMEMKEDSWPRFQKSDEYIELTSYLSGSSSSIPTTNTTTMTMAAANRSRATSLRNCGAESPKRGLFRQLISTFARK